MKSLILVPVIVFGLTACEKPLPHQQIVKTDLSQVPGLEGCTAHQFESRLYIVRCPNSDTTANYTYQTGKTSTQVAGAVVSKGKQDNTEDNNAASRIQLYSICLTKGIEQGLKPTQINDICNNLK